MEGTTKMKELIWGTDENLLILKVLAIFFFFFSSRKLMIFFILGRERTGVVS